MSKICGGNTPILARLISKMPHHGTVGGRQFSLASTQTTFRFAIMVCLLPLISTIAQADRSNEVKQASGQELFEKKWERIDESELKERLRKARSFQGRRFITSKSLADGLGPLHNATSCADCHAQGGASGVEHNVVLIAVDPRSEIVVGAKAHDGSELLELFPGLLATNGALLFETQVHARSVDPDYSNFRDGLKAFVSGGIDDKWFVPELRTSQGIASSPVITGTHGPVTFQLSQRNTPALHGLRLIDRVSQKRLEAIARKQSQESSGQISGRVVGRFGWRGQIVSLADFVREACIGELGLSVESTRRGAPLVQVDMTTRDLQALTNYVARFPQPADYSMRDRASLAGEDAFDRIGCSSCHRPDLDPARGIFSDLLLHDMGPELTAPMPAPLSVGSAVGVIASPVLPRLFYASKGTARPESIGAYGIGSGGEVIRFPHPFASPPPSAVAPASVAISATWQTLQREWRTPPLWGVADSAPYLHDGRAATLEEAILWHGGEAEPSRLAYERLELSEKANLLTFLSKLRAPAELDGTNPE